MGPGYDSLVKQSSLISQASLSTAGILAQGLSRFGFSVLVGRLVGDHALAVTSAWLSMTLILSLLWPTGAGNVVAHLLARSRAGAFSAERVVSRVTATVWPVVVGLSVVGVVISVIWLNASPADLPAIALLIAAYSGWIYTRGLLMGLGAVGRAALLDLLSSTLSIALLVAVIVLGADHLLVGSLAVGYAVFTIGASFATRKSVAGTEGAAPVYSEIVGTTGWNSAGLLASNGLVQFAMVYVVAVGPTGPAGRFAAAMSLATPASMLAQALSQVLIPRFSHATASGDRESVRAYRRTLGGMALVLGAMFGVGILLSPIVVLVVYGASYAGAIPLMQLLLVAMYFFSIGLIASSYLLSTHRARTSTICSAAGSILGLAVLVGGGGMLGVAQAAAAGVLVGYGVSAVAAIAVSLLSVPLREGARPEASVG